LLRNILFGRAIRTVTNIGVRHTGEAMDPSRKRRVRLVTALTVALLLAGALVYTTFSAASPERIPSQLRSAQAGQSYKLGGKVVAGSVERTPDSMTFQVQDPKGPAKVNVSYTGSVPDPFREGREVIVTVKRDGARFVGQRDSLVTKCPSKFQSDTQS
jgi:cytochrome c-type biogenesis protein CcmE